MNNELKEIGRYPIYWTGSMKSSLKIIILTVFLVLLLGLFFFNISKSRTFQFFGGLTNRVNTEEKVVALTFDDAPNEYTNDVLDILRAKNITATFYVIGENLEKYPQYGMDIVQGEHEIGNHSYSHQRFLLKSQAFIESEIEKTNDLIRETGYKGEITFRPPYGKKLLGLPYYLNKNNIKTILWDIEPDTYVSGDADAIVNYTLGHVEGGSIILLHPFCDMTCHADRIALPRIIDGLKSKGYSFVTISKLLEYK